jgi:hypothetical protein
VALGRVAGGAAVGGTQGGIALRGVCGCGWTFEDALRRHEHLEGMLIGILNGCRFRFEIWWVFDLGRTLFISRLDISDTGRFDSSVQ